MIEPLRCPAIQAPHGFFTRRGGVSSGPYASLNCSLSRGDARETVLENRTRAACAIGADPLSEPGTADLTAHVDFPALTATARDAGAAVHGPVPQGVFLTRLGLLQRTDRLARSQPPAKAMALIDSARRLAEPDRMGRLFKVLALTSPGSAIPPGFEA